MCVYVCVWLCVYMCVSCVCILLYKYNVLSTYNIKYMYVFMADDSVLDD